MACCAQPASLFDAAEAGDLARLRSLIQGGADPNQIDAHRQTALHHAAAHCRIEAVRLLLTAGADRDARDADQRTPATAARCEVAHQTLMLALMLTPPPAGAAAGRWTQGSGDVPWTACHAVSHGRKDVLSMLLALGADGAAHCPDGDRPLNLAALRGDRDIVTVLLERGVDPTLRNKSGSTPLHDAALKGEPRIVLLLLQYGADPNAADTESSATPLYQAASFGRLDTVRVLLENGADPSLRTAAGKTPLDAALDGGHRDVVALLRR
jgi:ankyrin repeat protein